MSPKIKRERERVRKIKLMRGRERARLRKKERERERERERDFCPQEFVLRLILDADNHFGSNFLFTIYDSVQM